MCIRDSHCTIWGTWKTEQCISYQKEKKGCDLWLKMCIRDRAIAEADSTSLTKEEKEKLKVTDNLSELDAKSAEELVKEGKMCIRDRHLCVKSEC